MTGNIHTVTLPDIGEGVVEGEVIEWLKNVGDPLKQDEPVVIVMTDKATVELPAPYPGILVKQYYSPGQISIKDKPLYDIQLDTQLKAALPSHHVSESQKSLPKASKNVEKTSITATAENAGVQQENAKSKAIPKVRHQAKEIGIDLNAIRGSGKEGRILVEDLISHQGNPSKPLSECPARFDDSQEIPLTGVRGMMAKKMDQATEIPMFSYFEKVEATRLIQIRQNLKKKAVKEGISLSYMPFFIRALALCAKKFPLLISSIDMPSKKLFIHRQHNIGIAMASEQGLIVPVMKDVQNCSLEEIIRTFEQLKKKAQSGNLEPTDMRGASITISNFGALPGDGIWATPIVNPPEVAILAIGRMRPEAVVRNGEVVIKEMIPFSWSFDHRVLDGEQAAAISHYFCSLVRDPGTLL